MGYTFKVLAEEVLSALNKYATVPEIWNYAVVNHLDDKLNSSGKTPQATLSAILGMDVRDNQKTIFDRTTDMPKKYFLKHHEYPVHCLLDDTNSETTELIENTTEDEQKKSFSERELHILLSTFVAMSPLFKCVTTTIYHEKSTKGFKGKNQWIHPDIVGIYFPFKDYTPETLTLYSRVDSNPYKLFSFELKINLNYTNLRESYFQAVSNSSWANEGYLVTLHLEKDSEFIEELQRLNNAFGIGIIQLNPKNISQSDIIFSSKSSQTLDFQTIDRLVTENPDFKEFMQHVLSDTTDNIANLRGKYDEIFQDDESACEYAEKLGIIN
ncbi:MAG: HTH domain-containing protein [Eubacteriales bacterium]